MEKTDSLMHPSQGIQPDNAQVDSNRETEHHTDDENDAEFRYVPEGEQNTSQTLGAATADQINHDTQMKHPSLEDKRRVRKVEQDDERTPGDDNPEAPLLQASQALTSK